MNILIAAFGQFFCIRAGYYHPVLCIDSNEQCSDLISEDSLLLRLASFFSERETVSYLSLIDSIVLTSSLEIILI